MVRGFSSTNPFLLLGWENDNIGFISWNTILIQINIVAETSVGIVYYLEKLHM